MTPRLMTGVQAAAYCELTLGTFSSWVAQGRLPGPIAGTRRWDRRAIDVALDRMSGLATLAPSDDPFAQWEREYETRKAARHSDRD